MPGVSEIVIPLFRVTSCVPLVTAGSSPTLATLRSMSVLISVDLPTFGMPTIIARTDFPGPLGCVASFLLSSAMRRFVSAVLLVVRATARTLPPTDDASK